MQLLHGVSLDERGVEWLKILANILFIVDAGKIEATTNGDWRRIICRCLCHLLDEKLRTLLPYGSFCLF
jgi:nucleolar pre-ribosomal-associated protein 1